MWSEGSEGSEGVEDKGKVCVRCEGVGGVGWGPQKFAIPFHMLCLRQAGTR